MKWSRRGMMAGAAAGIAAAAGALAYFIHPPARHYPPTPYDDLLGRLIDREAGARVGAAMIARDPGFDIAKNAATLRTALRGRKLVTLDAADIAAGRMTEAGGWILPQTLGLLCAVAAKA